MDFETSTRLAAAACQAVAAGPFGGVETLLLACFFLFLVVVFCVTFIDVAAKQMWPTFLDPAVAARVQAIQKAFPKLAPSTGKPVDPADVEAALQKTGSDVPSDYTHVVAQESYIAGRTVDEDLITVLANNSAYSTVSSYCSSTVRGYAMLSTVLLVAGVSLGFLWSNNVQINPAAGDTAGKISLLGYVLVFLTGIVMTNPNNLAVNRNANIALWSNVPLTLCGKSNPMLKLHDIGIVGFVAVPMLSHAYTLYTSGSSNPNYVAGWTGVIWQLIGAVAFGAATALKNKGLTPIQSAKLAIMAEVVAVFASFLAYLQWEFFSTSSCAGQTTQFHTLLLASAFAPFVFCAQRYWCAPANFPADPSVILMNGSEPVATSGPAPALVFDAESSAASSLPKLN